MVQIITNLHLVLHWLQFVTILQWIFTLKLDFSDEFNYIELPIFETSCEVDFAESSNGQAVVNLVLEELIVYWCPEERIEKFCFLDESFFEAKTIVEIDISV